MRRLIALVLIHALTLPAAAQSLPADRPLSDEERFELLYPGTAKPRREELFQAAAKASAAGSGYESFIIGVLFRHGQRHPSQIAPQRFDLARQFLQRCLEQEACPPMALASLSELEFEVGQVHWARVWALAYGLVEHEIAQRRGVSERRNTYASELLLVATESVPEAERPEHIATLLASVRKDLGPQLQRMIEQWAPVEPLDEEAPRVVRHPRSHDKVANNISGQRVYLLRLRAEGGTAAGVALIEALPNPSNGEFLDLSVRALEFSPLTPPRSTQVVSQPMSYVIPRPLPQWVKYD